MADEHADEAMELEFSEEDIAYYIVDEDDVEIGIALYDENGNEVEYYYADDDGCESEGANALADDANDRPAAEDEPDGELIELEFSEKDVAYYIVDEDGNEIGFALTEADGTETEYYYEGVDANDYAAAEESGPTPATGAATAAAAVSNVAAAAPAQEQKPAKPVPFAKRAGQEVGKLSTRAGAQASKAKAAAKTTVQNIKEGKPLQASEDEDLGFGLTANGVKKAAGEFTTLAKEGAETAAELKEVYDDIFGGLDFLKPTSKRR